MADLTKIEATTDLYCVSDFLPEMPVVSGRTALAHRLARRLQTPRGRFPWWPNFGTDLSAYLLTKTPLNVVAMAAESECLKDEQVDSITATVDVLDAGRTLHLTLEVTDAAGPFTFTLTIYDAAASLISLQANGF